MPERALELAAEDCEWVVVQLKRLEDDRRAALELGGDVFYARRPRERFRGPGNVLDVVAEDDLLVLLDDSERGVAEAACGNATLDLRDREQVVEAPLLVPRDEEGLPLPVFVEEAIRLDGLDAAR
jgi:hypothetical protein